MSINRAAPSIATPLPGSLTDEAISVRGALLERGLETPMINTGLNRDQFMAALKEHGIGTGLHFRAAHTHRWYRDQVDHGDSLQATEWNSDRICSS